MVAEGDQSESGQADVEVRQYLADRLIVPLPKEVAEIGGEGRAGLSAAFPDVAGIIAAVGEAERSAEYQQLRAELPQSPEEAAREAAEAGQATQEPDFVPVEIVEPQERGEAGAELAAPDDTEAPSGATAEVATRLNELIAALRLRDMIDVPEVSLGGEDIASRQEARIEALERILANAEGTNGVRVEVGPSGLVVMGPPPPIQRYPSNIPTGAIIAFGGSTLPPLFLWCDGVSYLRADYQKLFDEIGTAYGSVDGTHFNVPKRTNRYGIGAGDTYAVGASSDVDAFTSAEEDPAHTHALTKTDTATQGADLDVIHDGGAGMYTDAAGHTHTTSAVLPPYLADNYIIKT